MEPLYDVYFAGQLLEGQDLESVRLQLAKLFKANEQTLDRLFSGDTQLVKRSCDKATALKYQQAMKRAGARPIIRASAKASTVAAAEKSQPSQDETGVESLIQLSPVGTPVLQESERAAVETDDIDVSALELTAVGTDLSKPPADTPPPPDTAYLSMGEPGDNIPTLSPPATAPVPDTGGISLSPEGADFSDCAPPPVESPVQDLSFIELAPSGADMLDPQYRAKPSAAVPVTDTLKLNDQEVTE
ncbi:MAG: hypothetical protein HOC23_18125 [Halieaceae bacterium]|nr:hypothetical protein [Halieaceae bacterium]